MANRYWVGGSGSWGTTSRWSSTSGGAGGASVPTINDDVFVDNNSGSGTIYIGIGETTQRLARDLTVTRTEQVFISKSDTSNSLGGSVRVHRSIRFSSDAQVLVGADLNMTGSAAVIDLNSAPETLYNRNVYSIYVEGVASIVSNANAQILTYGGTVTLGANDLTLYTLQVGYVSSSMFNSNDYDFSVGFMALRAGGTMDLGSSIVTLGDHPTTNLGLGFSTVGTLIAGDAELVFFNRGSSSATYELGNKSLGVVRVRRFATSMNPVTLNGSGAYVGTLKLDPFTTTSFKAGMSLTIGALDANGTSSQPIEVQSSSAGSQFTLSKSSGTVIAYQLRLKDSNVTGGATWNAFNSVDRGNNTGWSVIGSPRIYPVGIPSAEAIGVPTLVPGMTSMSLIGVPSAEAIGLPTLTMKIFLAGVPSAEAIGVPKLTAAITNLGGIPSAEAVSPVSFKTMYYKPVGIPSAEAIGTPTVRMYVNGLGGIPSAEAIGVPTITQSPPPPPPPTDWSALGKEDEKVYLYKVYNSAGSYIGVWSDVKDTPQWTQRINTPGTTTTVFLSRSPNSTKEARANLLTEAGEPITTQDGQRLVTVYETPNSVGQDTDVDINYRVDIYVHYGQFDRLVTQDGEPITTQNGEYLLVASGAPLGVRVFSGYIMDYESIYGEEAGVSVTLASHGHELSQEVVRTGEMTTVGYNGTLDSTLKAVIDTNPGVMSYDSASIVAPGVTANLKFQLNTKLEAIDSIYNQTPDGWYWYGHVGENLIYMRPVSTGYDHTFVLERHIKSLRVRRSIESIRNVVYFVGGETTPGNVATTKFKKYTRPTSISTWRQGIERITDRRYTVDASMQRRADKLLSNYSEPIFTSPLVISSAKYDIESIKLGQTVGFAGFGNFIDELPPLQIVSYSYAATEVTVELGQVQERQIDSLSKVEESLTNEAVADIPTTPS